jgi:predicted TPR repeat methyltransferase
MDITVGFTAITNITVSFITITDITMDIITPTDVFTYLGDIGGTEIEAAVDAADCLS